jgi:hypothetical protein
MTSTALVSYSNLAAMTADTGQATGTFGQVTTDATYTNNGTYQWTGSAWNPILGLNFDLTKIAFTPQDFGAVGDGATNDTAAFAAMINAALSLATIPTLSGVAATEARGSVFLNIPPGIYLLDPGVLSTYTIPAPAERRTLVFRGSGWYNSSLILSGDGAFFYDQTGVMQFAVFEDIGFYGDSYIDENAGPTSSYPVTLPTSGTPVPPRVAFHAYGTDTVNQGWKFNRCVFSRFGTVFMLEGSDTESEITFVACKALRNGTWLTMANEQSQNINHYGCMIEQFYGNLVYIPSTKPTGGASYTGSGGKIGFDGGSILVFDPGYVSYLIDLENGSAGEVLPQVSISNLKIELRYDNNGLCKLLSLNHQWVRFQNVGILTAYSMGGTKAMGTLGAYNRLTLQNCSLKENPNGAYTSNQTWTLIGQASSKGENGRLEFIECQGAPTYDLVVLDSTLGTAFGFATNVRPFIVDYSATSEIQTADEWTVCHNWSKFTGYSKLLPELHRCALLLKNTPANGSNTTTVVLPLNAVINRIMCNIPPQGSLTGSITYTVTIGGTTAYTTTVAQQKNGVYFDIGPGDMTDPSLSIISTSSLQTVVFEATGGASSPTMAGFGVIEYW